MRTILIILAMLFGGCTTIKPPVAEYNIAIKDIKINHSVSSSQENSLKILRAFSTNSLATLNMDYTDANNRVYSYSQSQWQESPSDMISSLLLKNIRDSGLFSSVHPSKSRVKSDFILETNIEEFMQFYSHEMRESHVEVVISLSLIDAKTNSVVASKVFSSHINTKTLDANGGVEAFNIALLEIISKNIEWLSEICR
ncbi:ABC-type transport auxiliary lipoprotein family protein [Sulfurimonas sp.]|jgi:cholesterol transport system auxiliary component|uniref:ABC-type transport auxiliary lipoprotein family protein n=1 Tax=Sulfurimonas sp. TaxID=2022749 RepID=UPI0025E84065|nr:ABC-type transport auxiliary lipoprotein family protein [Sulfurimonas sp.]MCK9473872.1 ABC-type transport auxiliary lipoprotein family protein [Sulfurimonas sp.]MDD3505309.1 ABC-type transport auxiliary lipoprotein family protein [Sulfurimonas sp.]